jgi:hypothetical protein
VPDERKLRVYRPRSVAIALTRGVKARELVVAEEIAGPGRTTEPHWEEQLAADRRW